MTLLTPQPGAIPEPVPGPVSAPYWEGCARGELLFQRCRDCGGATHTPAVICAVCTSRQLVWEPSAGTGTVYSYTVVWRPVSPQFEVPYVPIIVDMAEGWSILSNLVGCEHDEVRVDLPVEVVFHTLEGGTAIPYFRPA